MPNSFKKFSKIDSDALFEGMHITADLYCKYKSNYVLVFKRSTLTKDLLQSIKKLENTYGNLYMDSGEYDKMALQAEYFIKNKKNVEFETNYLLIKKTANTLLDEISDTKLVKRDMAAKTSDLIHDRVMSMDAAIIFQILNDIRSSDEYLYTHSTNVGFLNGLMGKWLGMSKDEISALITGGLLHDIGKIMVPQVILNKPGKLTKEEFEIVKEHPKFAYDMLINSGEMNPMVLTAARNHHERVNGRGYPDKLVYDEISLAARITAISDMYDAMITQKVYKKPHSPFEILDEFARGSFVTLDMELVNTFLSNMPKELLGKTVLLSNGSIGEIVFIDETNISRPIVKVGMNVFQTDDDIKCVCMYKS